MFLRPTDQTALLAALRSDVADLAAIEALAAVE
jgi:hypothetical protein